ncbi:isocitrate lyase/phosphoenolpyruvate mutase family protein [Intrasporangium sp.]|uniref:isocitrate lyase/PEP mutase family protein n=1 Tax=Intrasporangium sp. TaxID=1925024 RepID=UPI0032221D79
MAATVDEFRSLHVPGSPLVLTNAWDAGSARLFENLGARAIATTSAGVAWANATPDGGALGPGPHLGLARRLLDHVRVPVTMDVENGYSPDPGVVARFLAELAEIGVVGVNLEDSTDGVHRDVGEFAGFLREVRAGLTARGADLFVNARVDTYVLGVDEPTDRMLERAVAYVEAGADGIFLIGLRDLDVIAAACSSLTAPVNILAGNGSPALHELARVGVARVSVGSWLARAAYSVALTAAAQLLEEGTFRDLALQASRFDLNRQMTPGT